VIVSCSSCGAKYRYEDSRFEGKPTKKIRCTKCETIFEIANPHGERDLHPEPPVNPPPVGAAEMTFARRSDPLDYGGHPGEATREHIVAQPKAASHPQTLRLPVGKKLSLAVISGPDSGKTFPVEKPRVVIGRFGADIALSDAEISRSHAAVEVDDESVTVFDLGSTNGTYVGGERIESSALDNYGEFEVGGSTLMLIVTASD
jgi:predicted Zn finger-like uncharacterized protein